MQRAALEAETRGSALRARDDAGGLAERREDVHACDGFERRRLRGWRPVPLTPAVEGRQLQRRGAARQDHRPVYRVLELPDVPGPGVAHERGPEGGGNRLDSRPGLPGVLRGEEAQERRSAIAGVAVRTESGRAV